MTLAEGFVSAVSKHPDPLLGDCWADAIRYCYSKEKLAKLVPDNGWYRPSIFFQGMKYVLFGDPTLPL